MKLAVITPIKNESHELVYKCVASVAEQSHKADLHVLILDGNPDHLGSISLPSHVKVITLPEGCEDTGATPRAVGSIFAIAQGCNGLLFLDIDNTWTQNHIESVMAVQASGAEVIISDRWICHHTTYEPLYRDTKENGVSVVDTNTLSLFGRGVMAAAQWWQVPRRTGIRTAGVDRYLWSRIQHGITHQGLKMERTHQATSYYRSRWIDHYRTLSCDPPNPAKTLVNDQGITKAVWLHNAGKNEAGQWVYSRQPTAIAFPKDRVVLIIGSMKSGTTSLFNYLGATPEICLAGNKEPEFFSENQGHKASLARYEELWRFDPNRHRYLLEASTGYTKFPMETGVPERIREYGLTPKFIYLMRNPFDRIVSHFNYMKRNPNWDKKITDTQLIATSNYYLQLSQFTRVFSKEQFLLLDFDELSSQPATTLKKVFEFLEIQNPVYPSEYPVVNEGKTLKKKGLTEKQHALIHKRLVGDMGKLHEEFGIDVKKWGF